MEAHNIFDKENHLQPDFDKIQFEALHSWDFGWEILSLINIAESREDDEALSRRFSPGQKALYFFWYLDAAVTNGGFVQFYWNDYQIYLPTIKNGLLLIGDTELLKLIQEANHKYFQTQNLFAAQKIKGDWEPLYSQELFDAYDNRYYDIHDNTMDMIEKYARANPEEFVKLK
ncbi:MAG: DUF4375 domain-containing protein [Bacteroidota bacterium]